MSWRWRGEACIVRGRSFGKEWPEGPGGMGGPEVEVLGLIRQPGRGVVWMVCIWGLGKLAEGAWVNGRGLGWAGRRGPKEGEVGGAWNHRKWYLLWVLGKQ